MSNITAFTAEAFALSFTDKKGSLHNITPEGALFKGGAAMAALKDHALESALVKAVAGRYRPACDILAAAFPSVAKAGEKFTGGPLWTNKSTFITFITAVIVVKAKDEVKGFNVKQDAARRLCIAYMKATAPAPAVETVEAAPAVETVEAAPAVEA